METTEAELLAWNTAKLNELQGDALEVAKACVERFRWFKLVSCARDYKDQARAMAQNAVAQRDGGKTKPEDRLTWIKETYWPSTVAVALQLWFEQHPTASEPDVVAGFTHLMSGLSPHELRALSKHIVIRERDDGDGCGPICVDDHAEAFDAEYKPGPQDDELCAFLREEAAKRGGKFLMREGNEIRRHWQAKGTGS